MFGPFASFSLGVVVGLAGGVYVGAKYTAAEIKAELSKIESSLVADAKSVIAAIRAKL